MRVQRCILLMLTAIAWTATPARAQWVVTPYLGINLAGDAEFRRGGPGVSAGYFGDRLGFEVDVMMRYGHFFKDKNVAVVPNNCGVGPRSDVCIDLNTRARSFMANVVVPIRSKAAKWRPYGVAGLGVIHPWVDGPGDQYDSAQNDLAFNVGGGVMYALNTRVGLRFDTRYIRALVDEDTRDGFYFKDYGFVRATFGITFGLPR